MEIQSENQARRRLINLIHQVKADLGIPSTPEYHGVDDPVAKALGIKVEERNLSVSDGEYLQAQPPSLLQPVIIIDPMRGDIERKNFTFFHEITHHLIREDDELYSFLNEYAFGKDFDDVLERFCHLGAAEFLVPSQDVRRLIDQQGFRITLIEELDHRYRASKPAIAIQLAQCASHECFVLVCDYGFPPIKANQQAPLLTTQPSTTPQLYIQYSARSPSVAKYSVARFTKIPKDHLLSFCFENKKPVRGRAPIPFRGQTLWECGAEAFFYLSKVYAAFHIKPPPQPPSLQPRLF